MTASYSIAEKFNHGWTRMHTDFFRRDFLNYTAAGLDFHRFRCLPMLHIMNEPHDFSTDPRIYMAAERTFLAWIRTGIAFMGFGFVVARFGLFLHEITLRQ